MADEKGGKDLLLKVAESFSASVTITTDTENVLMTAHGAVVGDVVMFSDVGANTDVTADTPYYVVSVVDANNVTIAETPGGTAITFAADLDANTTSVYKTVGGLRSKTFSFASEGIDITNHGSNQWRQLLDGAGIKSVSLSGSGVYTSAANYRTLETNALANTNTKLMVVDIVGGRVYEGTFKITSIEASGDYDGDASYSISAESASAVTIHQAA